MKIKTAHEKTPFITPKQEKSPNCGYIIWKYSKLIFFFTNDLNFTPRKDIL